MLRPRVLLLVACCAVAVGVIARNANAQLFDAKTIVITHNNGDPDGVPDWHLAEVEAYETGTGINVAASANGGVAAATNGSAFGTVPGDANDGNTNQDFGGGSVWHSTPFGAGDEFTIVLGAATTLDSIDFYGRNNCCDGRDDDLTLQVLDSGGIEIFNLDFGIPDGGQFISIPVAGNEAVPEPASIAMWSFLGLGLLAFRYYRIRCKK